MQILKDEIKNNIDDGALTVFSRVGYEAATVADVAACAGVSVGNIYRYYKSKKDLLAGIIPSGLIGELKAILFDKFFTEGGEVGITDRLISFILEHRREIIIVMNQGSGEGSIRDGLVRHLLELYRGWSTGRSAAGRSEKSSPDLNDSGSKQEQLLYCLYDNLIGSIIMACRLGSTAGELQDLLGMVLSYHMQGIHSL